MKTSITLLIAVLMFLHPLKGQESLPGGVPSPAMWGATESESNTFKVLVQDENGVLNIHCDNLEPVLLNYNPALRFESELTGIQIPMENYDLSKITVFTVFHTPDSTLEKSVWYMGSESNTQLLLTTHRIADWKDVAFMNFLNDRKDLPILNTYNQFKLQDTITMGSQQFVIGEKPNTSDIPIASFRGLFAEIIVYDRVLSPEEQQRIESYLSLKYGIPFSDKNLVNSEEKIVWDIKKNYRYNARITGLGRDDKSSLYQKQSRSSYDPDLLTIGAGQVYFSNKENPAVFNNNSYLIWGDNNEPFSLADKEQGKPQMVQRRWLMATFGETQHIETELRFDVRRMAVELSEGEIWWLAIDRSGTGDFSKNDVEYFPVEHLTPSGIAIFKNVPWDSDASRQDLFTIGKGPALMPKYWIDQPLCFPETTGKIYTGAEGGKPPYSFKLQSTDGLFTQTWISNNNELTDVTNIQSGDYLLEISDASGYFSSASIYVESIDAPVSELNSMYELLPDKELVLDATSKTNHNNMSYTWHGPDNFYNTNPRITILTPGTYSLTLNHEGCESRKTIQVVKPLEDNFKKVEVFPNPAAANNFNLAIYLHHPAKADIYVRNSMGTIVFFKSLNGGDYYRENIQVDWPSGIYFVTVISEEVSETLKLVVE